MKRLIAAVSFAVLAVPAFAAERGAPYEQTQFDRALPRVSENASAGATAARNERNLPYEQSQADRALADVAIKERPARMATRPFVDHNFIAPAL
jgi:hypothetical protein